MQAIGNSAIGPMQKPVEYYKDSRWGDCMDCEQDAQLVDAVGIAGTVL